MEECSLAVGRRRRDINMAAALFGIAGWRGGFTHLCTPSAYLCPRNVQTRIPPLFSFLATLQTRLAAL